MPQSPTVFVVQDSGRLNLTQASSFGTLRILLPARMQLQIDCTEAIAHMKDKLQDFDDCDCILATGDPAAISIAIAAAAMVNNGLVNMLKWDRQTNSYYKLPIDLSEILYEPFIGSDQ